MDGDAFSIKAPKECSKKFTAIFREAPVGMERFERFRFSVPAVPL